MVVNFSGAKIILDFFMGVGYTIAKVKESQNQLEMGGELMAILSDLIEDFLKDLINDTDGVIEIQRNELALHFKCVPSQINYVIDTRFTSERGYYVESRRGGGGYIKIKRINFTEVSSYFMHIINSIGDEITQTDADAFVVNFKEFDVINEREALLVRAALSDKALTGVGGGKRDILRASILKNMLLSLNV